MVFYAVTKGKNTGIFTTWNECNEQVKGFSDPIFKKFDTKQEAEEFITNEKKELHENLIPDYYVYTDGACSNNGSKKALAGIGIFFGLNDIRNVSKRISGKQTNNTAELGAIIETYKIIESDVILGKKITIVSDSEYAIKCATNYGEKCSKKNYMKKKGVDIPNKELVKCAYETYKDKHNIKFIHCKAHTGKTDKHSIGNDGADKLANEAIGVNQCPYITKKIFLNVPFAQKEQIKKLGGKWDGRKKKWFIYENNSNKDEILSTF